MGGDARNVGVDLMGANILSSEGAGLSGNFAVLNALQEQVREEEIVNLSSVSLGTAWEEKRETCGVRFLCSMCKKRKELGVNTGSMVRMEFTNREVTLCERCCNILVEIMQFGPRVLTEAFNWELRSRFLRASVVHEELVCGQCLQRRASHMFVKVRVRGVIGYGHEIVKDIAVRRCSKCVYAFLDSMEVVGVWREKFPYKWR